MGDRINIVIGDPEDKNAGTIILPMEYGGVCPLLNDEYYCILLHDFEWIPRPENFIRDGRFCVLSHGEKRLIKAPYKSCSPKDILLDVKTWFEQLKITLTNEISEDVCLFLPSFDRWLYDPYNEDAIVASFKCLLMVSQLPFVSNINVCCVNEDKQKWLRELFEKSKES